MTEGSIMRCAAIVCAEVAANAPILRASRSSPVDEADSGWQFVCGKIHENADGIQIWAVHQVLERDETLVPYIGFPAGTVLERKSAGDEWEVTVGPEEDRL